MSLGDGTTPSVGPNPAPVAHSPITFILGTTGLHLWSEHRGGGWQMHRVVGHGTHVRGFQGEDMIPHHHGEKAPPGMVGLCLEGAGTAQLRCRMAEGL